MLAEKYRPDLFELLIGQDHVKPKLLNIISRGEDIPHLLFIGPPGCGKTSCAYCVARKLYGEGWKRSFVELNASDERGIDTVRGKVKRYAQTCGSRIVLLDEADEMTKDAQEALRRILEKSVDTRFILTANHEYKLIDALKSRCAIFRFNRLTDEQVKNYVLTVLKAENVKFKIDKPEDREKVKEGIEYLVETSQGDLRKVLNVLEGFLKSDKLITVEEIALKQGSRIVEEAVRRAVSGKFEEAKQLVEEAYVHNGSSPESLIGELYETIGKLSEQELPRTVKIRLYSKLCDLESRCKMGSNPLIQLVGFMSYVWLAPHLPEKYPLV